MKRFCVTLGEAEGLGMTRFVPLKGGKKHQLGVTIKKRHNQMSLILLVG